MRIETRVNHCAPMLEQAGSVERVVKTHAALAHKLAANPFDVIPKEKQGAMALAMRIFLAPFKGLLYLVEILADLVRGDQSKADARASGIAVNIKKQIKKAKGYEDLKLAELAMIKNAGLFQGSQFTRGLHIDLREALHERLVQVKVNEGKK